MKMKDNSGKDEERSEEVISSLPVIAGHKSAGALPVPGVGECRVEVTLSQGRLTASDRSAPGMTNRPVNASPDEGGDEANPSDKEPTPEVENDAAAESMSAQPRRGSSLRFRIHLGMS